MIQSSLQFSYYPLFYFRFCLLSPYQRIIIRNSSIQETEAFVHFMPGRNNFQISWHGGQISPWMHNDRHIYMCMCLIVFTIEIHSMSHSSFNPLPPGFLIPSRLDICKSANGHRVPEVERYPRKVYRKLENR